MNFVHPEAMLRCPAGMVYSFFMCFQDIDDEEDDDPEADADCIEEAEGDDWDCDDGSEDGDYLPDGAGSYYEDEGSTEAEDADNNGSRMSLAGSNDGSDSEDESRGCGGGGSAGQQPGVSPLMMPRRVHADGEGRQYRVIVMSGEQRKTLGLFQNEVKLGTHSHSQSAD